MCNLMVTSSDFACYGEHMVHRYLQCVALDASDKSGLSISRQDTIHINGVDWKLFDNNDTTT